MSRVVGIGGVFFKAKDPQALRACLCEQGRRDGLDLLPLSRASHSLLRRARFAGIAPGGQCAAIPAGPDRRARFRPPRRKDRTR